MPVRTVAPKLGQQNAEIFRHLGLTDAQMHRLRREGRAVIRCVLTRIPRRRSQFCEHLGRLSNRLRSLVRDREKRRWLAPGAGARGLLCQGSCSRAPLLPRRLEEAKIAPQSR